MYYLLFINKMTFTYIKYGEHILPKKRQGFKFNKCTFWETHPTVLTFLIFSWPGKKGILHGHRPCGWWLEPSECSFWERTITWVLLGFFKIPRVECLVVLVMQRLERKSSSCLLPSWDTSRAAVCGWRECVREHMCLCKHGEHWDGTFATLLGLSSLDPVLQLEGYE